MEHTLKEQQSLLESIQNKSPGTNEMQIDFFELSQPTYSINENNEVVKEVKKKRFDVQGISYDKVREMMNREENLFSK